MKRNIEEGQSNVTPNQEENAIHDNIAQAIKNDDVNQIGDFITQGYLTIKNASPYLQLAVSNKALECTKHLLNNIKGPQGQASLHLAVAKGHAEAIAKMLNLGANINVQDSNGMTPLHLAVQNGKLEAIDLLIKAGADINAQGSNRITALHFAAANGQVEAIARLIKAGADINNAQYSDGMTALHFAAANGHAEAIDQLISSSITSDDSSQRNHMENLSQWLNVSNCVTAKTLKGMTALHLAAYNGQVEAIAKLVKVAGADLGAQDSNAMTPLHLAVQNGHLKAIDLLIKANAYVINTPDAKGMTALHLAVQNGQVEATNQLINAKANVNSKDYLKGMTALHLAVKNGQVEATNQLIEAGADVDAKDSKGRKPLHLAAANGQVEVINQLTKAKAYLNDKDSKGMTALHYAAANGHAEAINQLIKAGANITVRDNNGRTVLEHLAEISIDSDVSQGNLDCFKLLLEHGLGLGYESYGYQMYHTWANIAEVIRHSCYLNDSKQNLEVLNLVDPEELAVFSKNIMANFLINSTIEDNYRVHFKKACEKLPPALAKSLLSHLDKQIAAIEDQLYIVDAILIAKTQDLGHLPYNVLIKLYPEKEKAPEAEQKLLEFYESTPEYKTAGQYFLDLAQQSTEVENISDINYIMILHKDVADLILELNKCILFLELKKKVAPIVAKHNECKNNPVMHALIKQQGANKEQDIVIKEQGIVIENQAKDLENKQQEIVSLKACFDKMKQFMTTHSSKFVDDFAEYMGIELAHPNAAVNDNDIDVIGDLQNVNSSDAF